MIPSSFPTPSTTAFTLYKAPEVTDLGPIHEQTATYCDFVPDPEDEGSDSGVLNDPNSDRPFPRFRW